MNIFLVAEAAFALAAIGCFLYVLLAIAEGERKKAIALFLLTPLMIGPLLTFLAGIRRANRLGLENVMCFWAVCALSLAMTDLARLWTLGDRLKQSAADQVQAHKNLLEIEYTLRKDALERESETRKWLPPVPLPHVEQVNWFPGFRNDHLGPIFTGVTVSRVSPELRSHLALPGNSGVLVQEVKSGSGPAKSGLKQFDVLLEVNGRQCGEDNTALVAAELATSKAQIADLVVRRGQVRVEIKMVSLAE